MVPIDEMPPDLSAGDPSEPTVGLATQQLFGFDFIDAADLSSTVEALLGPQPRDGLLPLVSTPNVDHLIQMRRPEQHDLAAMVGRSRYVLPDGQPIVWTSRLAGRPLAARLPGSTLLTQLWPRLVHGARRVVVVAASDEVAARLREEQPELSVSVAPMFDVTDSAVLGEMAADLLERIERVDAEFVIVGLGAPKAQRLIQRCLDAIDTDESSAPVFMALGDSFAMHFGLVPRAPAWMQRVGLEWFHRFLREPRRLFRRYFVDDVRFLPMMIAEVRADRRAAGS